MAAGSGGIVAQEASPAAALSATSQLDFRELLIPNMSFTENLASNANLYSGGMSAEAVPSGGERIVVRFTPLAPDRLRQNAADTYDDDCALGIDPPRYGVSAVADSPRPGEGASDCIRRIVRESTLNGKTISVVRESELRAHGFDLLEDPNAAVPNHCLIVDRPPNEPPRVDVLASLLDNNRTRNPEWGKR